MTIKSIRRLQVACQSLLTLSVVLALFLQLLNYLQVRQPAGVVAGGSVIALVAGLALLLAIRKLRCPVCRTIYVGRRSPRYFTRSCSNCGRRSGDTA